MGPTTTDSTRPRPHPRVRNLPLVACLVLAVGCAPSGGGSAPVDVGPPPEPPGPIAFGDVTSAAGIEDEGVSYGAFAGDLDGDGWADLFTPGHYGSHPRLWHNQGDGTFVDRTDDWLRPRPDGDMHGCQFVDLEGDGAQELVVTRGGAFGVGAEPNAVYRRAGGGGGGVWTDDASALGLDVPPMRGRSAVALDWGRDGLTDLLLTAALRPDGSSPPAIYRPGLRGTFAEDPRLRLGWGCEFAVLGDLDGDGILDAVLGPTLRTFRVGGNGLTAAGIDLPRIPHVQDAVVADLDGDGRNELLVVRGRPESGFHLETPRELRFACRAGPAPQTLRIRQEVAGPIRFGWGGRLRRIDVKVGFSGTRPTTNPELLTTEWPFWGLEPFEPGVDGGVYVGFDPLEEEWIVTTTWPTGSQHLLRIESVGSDFVEVEPEGFTPGGALPPVLFALREGRMVDTTNEAGLDAPLDARSVVAADFDNDTDLDLYVSVTEASRNAPNVLYENLGDGRFVARTDPTLIGATRGVGDGVACLDYDRDGRLDLFLVHGGGSGYRIGGGSDAFADEGPAQLLRNVTPNANHWLSVQLQPTVSARAAIGTRIEVEAGGRLQVREFTGGVHALGQDHGIHFGTGPAAVAARVVVNWPSGRVTVLRDVPCDREVTVVE